MHSVVERKSIFFQSLGCVKNLVDAEVMLGITKEHHYDFVEEPQQAEVIVVNTCSFINESKRESIDAILDMAEHKKAGTCKKLIVTGCLAQRYKADLKVSFPEVDAFVGTGQYHKILEFIEGKKEDDFEFRHPKYLHNENTPRINTQPFFRAYLKVSEGCIKGCAFCIIPRIRGTLRSRTIPSLITEAKTLVASGAVELNLIAQDLTDYGRDLGDGTTLEGLLKELVKIEGLRWIRMLYLYPDEMSDELIELIATEEKICKYIDTPVQHINDRMLKLMNRKVKGDQIRERLSKLRARIPEVAIRSTVIVGYPGETEEEFSELVEFVKQAQFDHLGVFSYSHEENTASYLLPQQLDEKTKERRKNELMEVQMAVSQQNLARKVGRTVPVLVEGVSEESEFLLKGRHQGQAPDIDGYVLLRSGDVKVGEIHPVKLEQSMEYDFIGRAVPA
ncbi:MAG: 30S ribosomal protein S12 methylthiotransferase RimO [Proteobacteria bacterium]|nr:30S ribosomal protein S12 methylthiotransferase RimO [Pseudomonadota bacterium]NDC23916.1 30S ribosomal protein S12 methylthiotransferase RimO [Pseudomonadota bacterium]NDD03409.1 30S ribosomal protein S12 methylthiotransferase RimO [Pseudomonadota bacterium]NDG25765.1 30S ribosomal protein S12 methylthiotransferase RimO [Pseudomonadota bacterium]